MNFAPVVDRWASVNGGVLVCRARPGGMLGRLTQSRSGGPQPMGS